MRGVGGEGLEGERKNLYQTEGRFIHLSGCALPPRGAGVPQRAQEAEQRRVEEELAREQRRLIAQQLEDEKRRAEEEKKREARTHAQGQGQWQRNWKHVTGTHGPCSITITQQPRDRTMWGRTVGGKAAP